MTKERSLGGLLCTPLSNLDTLSEKISASTVSGKEIAGLLKKQLNITIRKECNLVLLAS